MQEDDGVGAERKTLGLAVRLGLSDESRSTMEGDGRGACRKERMKNEELAGLRSVNVLGWCLTKVRTR